MNTDSYPPTINFHKIYVVKLEYGYIIIMILLACSMGYISGPVIIAQDRVATS